MCRFFLLCHILVWRNCTALHENRKANVKTVSTWKDAHTQKFSFFDNSSHIHIQSIVLLECFTDFSKINCPLTCLNLFLKDSSLRIYDIFGSMFLIAIFRYIYQMMKTCFSKTRYKNRKNTPEIEPLNFSLTGTLTWMSHVVSGHNDCICWVSHAFCLLNRCKICFTGFASMCKFCKHAYFKSEFIYKMCVSLT